MIYIYIYIYIYVCVCVCVCDWHLYSRLQTQLRECLVEFRGAGATWAGGADYPAVLRLRGTLWQPCALCNHYNILYFFLNIFYHSKLKFTLPKFEKQKHQNFANEMRNEREGARTNHRWPELVCQVRTRYTIDCDILFCQISRKVEV